jgi:hypothetical protein
MKIIKGPNEFYGKVTWISNWCRTTSKNTKVLILWGKTASWW